ncbi:agmatinase [Glaciecola sp. SC05]|uniref:agmatinase n=1 Tax=Glaciecola sp. SC05 TaxID=1987355 RepID=UPI00352715D5
MGVDFSGVVANDVALIGVPFDAYSSQLKGAALAPKLIRDTIFGGFANATTELGVDLKAHPHIKNLGDIVWCQDDDAFPAIQKAIAAISIKGAKPLVLGGDHSITYPIIKSLAKDHDKITILHFDAHPDLYDNFAGNPHSHASPFARIMENGLASRLVQVGIRTLNKHQREQAERFNVEIHEMRHWQGPEQVKLTGPVYISIDIDALDPAYAPGVSHQEPGGLSVRQMLAVIQSIEAPIIGADIVEYNPVRDVNNITAMVAMKLYKEVCGKMLTN